MAETIPGGRYKVGDEWQNANGEKIDGPSGATSEGDSADLLDGVQFASAAARTAAEEAGMTAADFAGKKGSSTDGFTKPDVMALIEAQDAE